MNARPSFWSWWKIFLFILFKRNPKEFNKSFGAIIHWTLKICRLFNLLAFLISLPYFTISASYRSKSKLITTCWFYQQQLKAENWKKQRDFIKFFHPYFIYFHLFPFSFSILLLAGFSYGFLLVRILWTRGNYINE